MYEWQYTRIEMEGAVITMRRPIQINSDYVFSVAPDWILARTRLQINGGIIYASPVFVEVNP